MIRYLSNYAAGVVIHDARIVSDNRTDVTIKYKDYRRGGETATETMPGVEFVRRFMLHIMPRSFCRVRYIGILSPRHRAKRLAKCQKLLADRMPNKDDKKEEEVDESKSDELLFETPDPKPPVTCPRCRTPKFQLLPNYEPDTDDCSPRRSTWSRLRQSWPSRRRATQAVDNNELPLFRNILP